MDAINSQWTARVTVTGRLIGSARHADFRVQENAKDGLALSVRKDCTLGVVKDWGDGVAESVGQSPSTHFARFVFVEITDVFASWQLNDLDGVGEFDGFVKFQDGNVITDGVDVVLRVNCQFGAGQFDLSWFSCGDVVGAQENFYAGATGRKIMLWNIGKDLLQINIPVETVSGSKDEFL